MKADQLSLFPQLLRINDDAIACLDIANQVAQGRQWYANGPEAELSDRTLQRAADVSVNSEQDLILTRLAAMQGSPFMAGDLTGSSAHDAALKLAPSLLLRDAHRGRVDGIVALFRVGQRVDTVCIRQADLDEVAEYLPLEFARLRLEIEACLAIPECEAAAAGVVDPVLTEPLTKDQLGKYFNCHRNNVKDKVLAVYHHETVGDGRGERYRMHVADMPPAYQQKYPRQKS